MMIEGIPSKKKIW